MNIFIDTSIFIKNNYLSSYSIKQLFQLSENLKIQIYITDIIEREYLKNLKNSFNDFSVSLNKNPIWKNINSDLLNNIHKQQLDSKFYQTLLGEFNEKINRGIIKVIKTPNNLTNSVLDLYFNCSPPFDDKRKKTEFLDAFILLTIEDWCAKNQTEAILFSTDKDQLNYSSNKIRIESDFNNFLVNFVDKSLKIENIPINEKIDELLKINSKTVFEQIKYLFEAEFIVNLSKDDYRLENLAVLNIDNPNYKILSADENQALIEYPVCIHYNYKLSEFPFKDEKDIVIEDDNYITLPFEIMLKLDKGLKKGGYDLIQVDIKHNYKRLKINCD